MTFRLATAKDLPFIVQLLANDKLGQLREKFADPLPEEYVAAFKRISEDENQELIVGENEAGEIVATLQLSFIQYLTYCGGIRAQVEAVRIREDLRGRGVGQKLLGWAIERARSKKAHLLQLTTDKQRPEAMLFYERLGFVASHEGMKLNLLN